MERNSSTFDTQSNIGACHCVFIGRCGFIYLQQESLVFDNSVFDIKVLVASKFHRNNGPASRRRENTHTHRHTHTYISLEPHYIEQCFQSSPSIHLSRTQSRQAEEYASPLPHNQVSPHTQKHLCFLFFTCSAIVEGYLQPSHTNLSKARITHKSSTVEGTTL